MAKKKKALQLAQERAQEAINLVNERIEVLGEKTSELSEQLGNIQMAFDEIRNVPTEKKLQYEELKQIRLNWIQQAEKIENDYKKMEAKNAGAGVAGAGAGVAVAALGPTAAMGVATTFGVASTGTAISSLSGAAATNAALAWIGGGAVAAGGGGMAAGEAILALAGPIGWAIAGVSLLVTGILFFKARADKKRIDSVFEAISDRDVRSYELAIVELNERITRINDETKILSDAIEQIKTFGTDYNMMTEAQQYELGSYVNLMGASTQLLVNPILGLQPKYSEADFEEFISTMKKGFYARFDDEGEYIDKCVEAIFYKDFSNVIIFLANFLYKIELDEIDKKLIWKALRKNKMFIKSLNITKKIFDRDKMEVVRLALIAKYAKEGLYE